MTARIAMVGRTFGRLLVIAESARSSPKKRYLDCRCECGKETIVCYQNLAEGVTKSCGCLRVETARRLMTTHGATLGGVRSRAFESWLNMRARCENTNPTQLNYSVYAGRGIAVCERWQSFENFIADMGECPPDLTLERKDNYRGYSPDNCVWASRSAQSLNRRPYQEWTTRKPRGCLVTGCPLPHGGHGYCGPHLHRFRRHGDPLVVKRQRRSHVHHV